MRKLSSITLILFLCLLTFFHGYSQHGELIPSNLSTNKVIRSGNWNDPSIWENGQIPSLASIVHIPSGFTVNYNTNSNAHLFALSNDGTLNFNPSGGRKLKLVVDTFISSAGSTLDFKAERNSDGSIEVVFKAFDIEKKKRGGINGVVWNNQIKNYFSDGRPIKRLRGADLFDGEGVYGRYGWDPAQLSLGLITMGKVRISGEDKTDFLPVTGNLNRNANRIQLAEVPSKWRVGDEIILSGTELRNQSEIFKIRAINGSTITIDGRLRFNHKGIREANWFAYVGNITRNILFTTAEEFRGVDKITSRGHVMFMHNPDVVVNNAQFLQLGRTDKTNLLDDLEYEISNLGNDNARMIIRKDRNDRLIYEKSAPNHIENQRGRYGLHFHKTLTGGNGLVKAEGNVVWGSPGWGMVHHDSNADFKSNVVLKASGGMIAESGSEIGTWENNLCVSMGGLFRRHSSFVGGGRFLPAQLRRDARKLIDDDFRSGEAYGLQSRAVKMLNNVAGDCGIAYHYQSDGEDVEGVADLIPSSIFSNAFGYDAFPLEEKILRSAPPLLLFKDNLGFNCNDGFKSQNRTRVAFTRLFSVIENLTIWNSKRFGIYVSSNFGYLFKNNKVHCSDNGRVNTPQAALIQTHDDNLSFSNVQFYNFPRGIEVRSNIRNNRSGNHANSEFLFHKVRFFKSINDTRTTPSNPYLSFTQSGRPNGFKVFENNLPNGAFEFTEGGRRLDKQVNVRGRDFKIAISGEVSDRAGTHAFANYSPSFPTPFTFREYNFENDDKLVRYLQKTSSDADPRNDPVIDNSGNGHAFITEFISDRLTAEIYRHYFRFNIRGTSFRTSVGPTPGPVLGGTTQAPVGQVIWMQSKANSKYVVSELRSSNIPLEADRERIGTWEHFEVVDAGSGMIALKAINDKFVTNDSNGKLFANKDTIGDDEKFEWFDLNTNEFALKSVSNGKYVQARINRTDAPLFSIGERIRRWETFVYGLVSSSSKSISIPNSLILSPNPASNILNISGLKTGNVGGIYSLSGKKLIQFEADDTKISINVSRLSKGIYIVSMEGGQNKSFVKE